MSIFGNMKDLMNMASRAKEIQANLKATQEEIAKYSVTVTDGSGQVTVTVTGEFFISNISISPSAPGLQTPHLLETAVAEAYNKALVELKQYIAGRMKEATGGLDIPGLG